MPLAINPKFISSDMTDDAELAAAVGLKVDKVVGKGLSTEDYTTTEKSKLSAINSTSIEVNFGSSENDSASATVSAAWISSSMSLTMTITPNPTDHDVEDSLLEELSCSYGNIIDGVSFDVYAFAPNGTHGRYIVKVIGV